MNRLSIPLIALGALSVAACQQTVLTSSAPTPSSEEERAAKRAKQQAAYERRMAIQKRREEALANQSQYVDPFAAVLAKYNGRVPIAVIIEPDSLPNLATNLATMQPQCAPSNYLLRAIPTLKLIIPEMGFRLNFS